MARNDALLRITKLLLAKRTQLRKRLGMQLDQLDVGTTVGDSAEAAFTASGEEIATQLAQLDARELGHIELALHRVKQGMYGVCNGCEVKIPVARLDALPYSVLCIKCAREAEKDSRWLDDRLATLDFNKMGDSPSRELSLADFDLSK